MIIGYARTSTLEQEASFEDQQVKLEKAGAEKVYKEQVSAVGGNREQLGEAIEYLREGDVFAVVKLDRLARSTKDLLELVERIEQRGASLSVLDMQLDTSTPTGKLMLGVIGSVAQFERELMLERQRIGIAKAKAEGKYKGRKPTAMDKADEIRQLKDNGVGASEIAKQLNISRASVYRAL